MLETGDAEQLLDAAALLRVLQHAALVLRHLRAPAPAQAPVRGRRLRQPRGRITRAHTPDNGRRRSRRRTASRRSGRASCSSGSTRRARAAPGRGLDWTARLPRRPARPRAAGADARARRGQDRQRPAQPGARALPARGLPRQHGRTTASGCCSPAPSTPPGTASTATRSSATAASPRPSTCERTEMPYDLLIKNGVLIDGIGQPRHRADVAVRDGRIAAIGRIREARARSSTPTAWSSRRASSTATPTWTRRSSGIRSGRPPAGTASPASSWATAASRWRRARKAIRHLVMRNLERAEDISARRWRPASTGAGRRSPSCSTRWRRCPRASTTRATSATPRCAPT